MTFIASMTDRNAPETPQRARSIEIIAAKVKALSAWLLVSGMIWFSMKVVAYSGNAPETCFSMSVTRLVALKRPSSESKNVKKGKMAKSAL